MARFGLLLALIALVANVGCAIVEKGLEAAVDGVASYCETNPTVEGRLVVRNNIRDEVEDERLEICLGCPGDEKTYCVGEPREKVED